MLEKVLRLQSNVAFAFLGCIECMRCRLLLPMRAVSVCQSVRPAVCLSVCHAAQLDFTVLGLFGTAFAKLLWPLVLDMQLIRPEVVHKSA